MERARVAILAALLTVLSVSGAVIAATVPGGFVPGAAVGWPVSTTLLLAEVQTGGASASDEFVEVTNAGAATADLAGLEVVYVTATGGTVTRKATWTAARPITPGQHLLIANSSGIFAGLADATYSSGFAATGGSLVLRPVGGAPIDAVSWGDATNAFVEGSAAPAPAAGASIERLPGGLGGNTIDTNANVADWFGQASPNPQSLAAPPVPAPGPSATATASPAASPSASPSATPAATATLAPSASPEPSAAPSAEPSATVEPTATPEPSASAAPTPAPTVEPTPEPTTTPLPTPTPTPTPTPSAAPSATPEPTPTVSPSPSPSPSPVVTPIAGARLLADGSVVTVEGILTTQLGALEAGRKGFVQDTTAGIAIYLDAAVIDGLPAGTAVRITGTLDDRYAERTLRASEGDIAAVGDASLPAALTALTGEVGEPFEGTRVTIDGLTIGSPSALADGLGIMVDDGTGAVRAILGADALAAVTLPAGTHVSVTGPVGQHDSSGTGTASYRVHATLAGELVVLPDPSPPPTPSPEPTTTAAPSPTAPPSPTPTATAAPGSTPTPGPTATPAPTASPSPSATPAPSPSAMTIHAARSAAVGTVVTVEGVVTAEAGRLGTPPLFAIADSTGGIVVRLPDGATSPGRGATVRVTGSTADPYGQLEIRPAAGGLRLTGTGVLPAAATVSVPDLGEPTEATLVQILGTVTAAPAKGTSGDLVIDAVDSAGRAFRVTTDGSSGIKATDIPRNQPLRFVGILGQHASRKGALDGYRVWLRDRGDVTVLAGASPSQGPGGANLVSVATALAAPDGSHVTIEATVTAGVSLLDSSGRRVVVQDASGAIEVLLPSGAIGPAVGAYLRIEGEKAHAWGAPRIKASTVRVATSGAAVSPAARATTLGEHDEWRLVRVSGTVTTVHRIGDRWTAELRLPNGDRVPILGQAGAGIASTTIVEGRAATIVGIVKRPYPTATDRRFGVLPRGRSDVAIGPAPGTSGVGGSDDRALHSGSPASTGAGAVTPDTDLATLFEHIGQEVRVGGLVRELTSDGFLLDDGTAVARLVLHGDALVLLPHIHVGDALAATGTVQQRDERLEISIASAAGLVRVGDLGQALPLGPGADAGGAPSPVAGLGAATLAGAGSLGEVPAEISLATVGGVTLLSVLVTLLRRRAATRRSRALVLARLATLTGGHR